jgi:conjugative transposon TraK protein
LSDGLDLLNEKCMEAKEEWFPKTRGIERSFQYIRWVSIAAIVGSVVSGILFFLLAGRVMLAAQSRVYILSAGKAMEAFASDRRSNLAVEARAHVYDFLTAFFTLDPDERYISAGLRRALYLADRSAKRVYDDLKESGYYAQVVTANISQRLQIDSISLDMHQAPYYFRCYGTETITRATSIVTRDLVTEGWLREVERSENDPHGFLVERWTILENRDVKIEHR